MTLPEVISQLEQIVAQAHAKNARYGYFATLYLGMTRDVAKNIGSGGYQDVQRMERLCIVFAQRYLDAFQTWRTAGKPTGAWAVAFGAGVSMKLTTIQHLLLGVNAHINLDLGIAAQIIQPGESLHTLQSDFNTINDSIAALFNVLKHKLGKLSWPVKMLDDFGGSYDDVIANFSIKVARDEAWKFANTLNSLPAHQHAQAIETHNHIVCGIANKIIAPGVIPNMVLKPIAMFEPTSVTTILSALADPHPTLPQRR